MTKPTQLVLSLFPGLGLLDRAFALEGFCVVRGPDPFWGGDVRGWHPLAGRFDGVIGGPPCQPFTRLRHLLAAQGKTTKTPNLIPEFSRCVHEAAPFWFALENVPAAPDPSIAGYWITTRVLTDWKCGGRTMRARKFWFGFRRRCDLRIDESHWPSEQPARAVTRNCRVLDDRHRARAHAKGRGGVMPGDGRYQPIETVCELQGLPRNWTANMPFKKESLRVMLGNGVPQATAGAVARAIKEAIGQADTR